MTTSTKTLEFTREEFYDLVWEKSLRKISEDFQMKYSDIRKITKDYKIPVPTAGYWSKLKYDKPVSKTPLPNVDLGNIKIIPGHHYKPNPQDEYLMLVEEIENDSRLNLHVPEKLPKKRHPIVSETIKFFKGKFSYNPKYRTIDRNSLGRVRVAVDEKYKSRAFRILNTFIKAIEDRGHSWIFSDYASYVVIKGIEFDFELQEKRKRIQVKGTYGFNTELESTGILYIKIDHSYHHKTWSDSKTTILEDKLSQIIAYLEIQAEEEIIDNIETAIGWHISHGKEAIEKAKRAERDYQVKKLEKIISDSKLWHQAQNIRTYLNHLKDKATKENNFNPELKKTLEFGYKKADWLDPTVEIKDEVFNDLDPILFLKTDK
ncbi:MAG: hypothetical protein ACQEWD_14355 [Bacteroidota bacterium]